MQPPRLFKELNFRNHVRLVNIWRAIWVINIFTNVRAGWNLVSALFRVWLWSRGPHWPAVRKFYHLPSPLAPAMGLPRARGEGVHCLHGGGQGMASSETPLEPCSWCWGGKSIPVTQEVPGIHLPDSMVSTFVEIRPKPGSASSSPEVFKTDFPLLCKIDPTFSWVFPPGTSQISHDEDLRKISLWLIVK